MQPEPERYQFKVVVVGDSGVGKSSLIQRSVTGKFVQEYRATIGADIVPKRIQWNEHIEVIISFWDIAGQERFRTATTQFIRGADGAIIVYDVTDEKSRVSVTTWKEVVEREMDVFNGEQMPVTILFGNKLDLLEGLDRSYAAKGTIAYAQQLEMFAGYPISIAENQEDVDIAIAQMVREMIRRMPEEKPVDTKTIKLTDMAPTVNEARRAGWMRSWCSVL